MRGRAPAGLGWLQSFIGYHEVNRGALSASATVMLLPVPIILLPFQRLSIRGLTFGSVRG